MLNAVVKPINTLSTQRMRFEFSNNAVKIQFKGTPSFPEFIKKNAYQAPILQNPTVNKMAQPILNAVLATTEKPMTFKCK